MLLALEQLFFVLCSRITAEECRMTLIDRLKNHIGLVPNPISKPTREAHARVRGAAVHISVCPYCAVGCSQLVYTKGGRVIDIEGNYESPINGGTLCPKGAATSGLMN